MVPKIVAGAWLGIVVVVEAYGVLVSAAELWGLEDTAAKLAAIATIIVSLGVIFTLLRRAYRHIRRFGRAITTVLGLDEKLDEHRDESRRQWVNTQQKFAAGSERMYAIEEKLAVLAQAERAAVRGALEATATPRSARSTDPGMRTGWRE